LKGSVKEPNMFHNCETELITRKASDGGKPAIISNCLVLPPEIVMHDAINVIIWTSADICVVHDNLGWKTEQHVVIGFGELAAVD